MKLTKLFQEFFNSEKAGGLLLILCAALSILLANSGWQVPYINFWKTDLAGAHLDHWINDGLMAIFFLLIGLELEREVYTGELASFKNAMLPIAAALGGMLVPAAIHLWFNFGTSTQSGAGIPMATDIAFALGVLSLLGNRVPTALKIFLTAFAIIDDIGAIITIAVFYSKGLSFLNLGAAMGIFLLLGILNRLKVRNLVPYLVGGIIMWYFMLHSGIHATISGVLLAFVIPFGSGDEKSPSYILQHLLHKPVAFLILPLFALANTAINIPGPISETFSTTNSTGIFLGLVVGKPVGVLIFVLLVTALGLSTRPAALTWKSLVGLGMLGGIGFTMSMFITLLAFNDNSSIDASKIVIMVASATSAILGFAILYFTLPSKNQVLES